MIYYLPEKMYEAIKQDPTAFKEYTRIVRILKKERDSYTTLTDGLKMENEKYIQSNEVLSQVQKDMAKLISDNFTQNKQLAYLIQMGKFRKYDLERIYNKLGRRIDDKAICLSEIVDNSYGDNSFVDYMHKYIELYLYIPKITLMQASVFTHMKYMKASIYLTGYEYNPRHDNFMSIVKDINSAYNAALSYTNKNEVITHAYVECICDFLNLIMDRTDANAFAITFRSAINAMKFQYDEYSFGMANFLYILSRIQLKREDYTGFVNTTEELVKYIDNSLKNIPQLIAGLNFYDKTNITMYFSLIRWIIRLNKDIPMIKANRVCELKNLQITDYNTAIANMTDINSETMGEKVMVCSNAFSKSIDDWFTAGNPAYIDLKRFR